MMPRVLKNHWPLFGLGLLSVVVAFYLARAASVLTVAPLLSEAFYGKGMKLAEVHYIQDDPDENTRWVVDAREVWLSEDKEVLQFHDFELKVLPQGRPWLTLVGKKGRYTQSLGEIELEGDLEGRSEDGYRILTQRVVIHEKEGQLTSEDEVRIFGPFFEIQGTGLFADVRRSLIQVLSRVTTVIQGDKTTL